MKRARLKFKSPARGGSPPPAPPRPACEGGAYEPNLQRKSRPVLDY